MKFRRINNTVAFLFLFAGATCSRSSDSNGSDGDPRPDGGVGGSLSLCEPFGSGAELRVCSAGYVTDDGDDAVGGVAIAIAKNGSVIYAGTLRSDNYGLTPTSFLAGGRAGLLVASANGRIATSKIALGASIKDVAVAPDSGDIAVCGDFGLAVLNSDATALRWSAALGDIAQCSIGTDNTTVAILNGQAHVYDTAGIALPAFSLGAGNGIADIIVDGARQHIIVTGFKQDDGGGCTKLQIPFVRAFTYDGQLAWKA
jgi:hypothetical protein